jgi:hypothetical protein
MKGKISALLCLAAVVFLNGCGGSSTRSSDLPLNVSPGVDPKTGKVNKRPEVGFEDPAQVKK